jgi:transposase-like protein
MRLAAGIERIQSDQVIAETHRAGASEQPPTSRSTPTEAELRRLYLEQNQTVHQIAAAHGCSEMLVARLMEHYGISRRPRGHFRPKLSDATVADILNRYRAGGTVPRIADELDLHRSVVRQQVEDAGITRPRRPVSETDMTDEQLRAEYERGASVMDLVENHDLIRHSVLEALARAGTQMRPSARSIAEPPAASTGDTA